MGGNYAEGRYIAPAYLCKERYELRENSVIYRLGKIKTETGLDARKFWDLVKLLEMEES